MILDKNLDEVIFDQFPKTYRPRNKIFISHLLHLDTLTLPQQINKIYTTPTLASQILLYFKHKNIERLNEAHIKQITPNVPFILNLISGEKLQILPCESKGFERNLIYVIKSKSASLKDKIYVYGGMGTDIRSVMLNDYFAEWIQLGVDILHLDLTRAFEKHDPKETLNAIDEIKNILILRKAECVQFVVPTFGYERLIATLVHRFEFCVALKGILKSLYNNMPDLPKCLQENEQEAKIIVTSERFATNRKTAIVKPSNKGTICNEISQYYEVKWSPLPTPFHLKLLTNLVRPIYLNPILSCHTLQTQRPEYLKSLCGKNSTGLSQTQVNKPVNPSSQGRRSSTAFKIKKPDIQYLDDSD